MQILKRNGLLQAYDRTKIENAIQKAFGGFCPKFLKKNLAFSLLKWKDRSQMDAVWNSSRIMWRRA